jgi:hypothetical protein
MRKNNFPRLSNLIRAVFNQDWACYFEEWRTCFDCEVLKGGHPVGNKWLLDEITHMLGHLNDTEIEAFFHTNNADIDPPDDAGMSHREWLQEIQKMIIEDFARRTDES